MGVDQLVTGGDVDDPVVDSLTSGSVKADKLSITPVDLSAISAPEDGELYYHNGASEIPTPGGGTTSISGIYRYDESADVWHVVGGGYGR